MIQSKEIETLKKDKQKVIKFTFFANPVAVFKFQTYFNPMQSLNPYTFFYMCAVPPPQSNNIYFLFFLLHPAKDFITSFISSSSSHNNETQYSNETHRMIICLIFYGKVLICKGINQLGVIVCILSNCILSYFV